MSDEQKLSQDELESVMRRVHKLLAIAADTRANPAEAASAASMAEKTLRRYQLNRADAIAYKLKHEKGQVIMLPVFGNMKRNDASRPPLRHNPDWCQHLTVYVARLNDCEARQGLARRPQTKEQQEKYGIIFDRCLEIYGYAADAQTAQWMYDYLVGVLILACEAHRVPVPYSNGLETRKPTKVQRNEFRRGFVAALCAKLERLCADKMQERLAHQSSGALVLVKKEALEAEFGSFNYKEAEEKPVKDSEAFHAGVREGRKVDVGRKALGQEEQQAEAAPMQLQHTRPALHDAHVLAWLKHRAQQKECCA